MFLERRTKKNRTPNVVIAVINTLQPSRKNTEKEKRTDFLESTGRVLVSHFYVRLLCHQICLDEFVYILLQQ